MKEMVIIHSVLFFMAFWSLGILLLWFRPRIEPFWKIIASCMYLFYLWFFWTEIEQGITAFQAGWYGTVISFFREFVTLVFINLFFIWPVALVLIFYKADDIGAERLLKFISILTLVLWVLFVIYFYFQSGIDTFLFDQLKKMVPRAQ